MTATTHDDVGEALKIMSRPNPLGWVELYTVYEIVRAAGALGQARTAAGLEEAELVLFRRTANHPQASGTDGRHARSAEQPPTKPMDVAQARQIISRLVQAWMDTI